MESRLFIGLCLVQGAYFLGTGIWPLVNIRTFMKVTGPKTDLWLVKTVGVLVTAIGAVLIVAAIRQQASAEIYVLAIGSALGLTGIDVWYVIRKIISPIYLVDAILEIVLIGLWVWSMFPHQPEA